MLNMLNDMNWFALRLFWYFSFKGDFINIYLFYVANIKISIKKLIRFRVYDLITPSEVMR